MGVDRRWVKSTVPFVFLYSTASFLPFNPLVPLSLVRSKLCTMTIKIAKDEIVRPLSLPTPLYNLHRFSFRAVLPLGLVIVRVWYLP